MGRFTHTERVLLLFLAMVPGPGSRAQAQYVHGLVLYTHDDRPVALATVRLVAGDGTVLATELSDFDGRFAMRIDSAGTYWVHAEHLTAFSSLDGPFRLSGTENTLVVFYLVPQPMALEGLSVEVERQSAPLARTGFYERQKTSSGFFVTPEDVKKRSPRRTSDLLRTIPGLQFVEAHGMAGFSGYPLMSWSERGRFDPRPCFPRVYVDGVVVEQGGTTPPNEGFDTIVRAHDVVAMEVYRSPAETPAQFGGLSACGVIMLWTERGRPSPR